MRVAQEFLGQIADLDWHGGGEQHCLAHFWQFAKNTADGWREAKVQHLVGFVQNNCCCGVQLNAAGAHVIFQTAWGRDHNVQTFGQGAQLWARLHTTKNHCNRRADELAVGAHAFGDLGGQLAGGCQNERAAGVRRWFLAVFCQTGEQWQHEGGSFAGACLCDAEDVLALFHQRDHFALDWGWSLVALFFYGVQDRFCEASFVKILHSRTSKMCGARALIWDQALAHNMSASMIPADKRLRGQTG